jgi:hypothetical protein
MQMHMTLDTTITYLMVTLRQDQDKVISVAATPHPAAAATQLLVL